MELPSAIRRMSRWLLSVLCLVVMWAGFGSGAEPVVDSLMYHDPDLPAVQMGTKFPSGILELWLEALERRGVDFPCQAACAIAEAHRRGLKGVERAVPALVRVFDRPNGNPMVRLAVAQALVELEARSVAPNLTQASNQDDLRLLRVVTPALARWHYRPACDVWLQQLDPAQVTPARTALALSALGTMRESRAVPAIRSLVLASDQPAWLRVAAARALGEIEDAGLEDTAQSMLRQSKPSKMSRLIAVSLLRHHNSPSARKSLQQMLRDDEPAVVRVAAHRLLELDARLLLPEVDHLLTNRDPQVRQAAVETLYKEITPQRLEQIGQCCNNPYPEVRKVARERLLKLAERTDLRPTILKLVTKLLGADDWRGQEAAAILAGQLRYRPVAGRLVQLLNSPRPEVCLATAWALRRVQVADALPAVLKYVADVHTDVIASLTRPAERPAVYAVLDDQISQLVQLLGQMRYKPAEPVLRRFVPRRASAPRPPVASEARAAAIWVLGLFHEDHPDPALAKQFERDLLAVFTPTGGDTNAVTIMLAVSLGRMKARQALGGLQEFHDRIGDARTAQKNAAAWAINHITGKSLPLAKVFAQPDSTWFLKPSAMENPPVPQK